MDEDEKQLVDQFIESSVEMLTEMADLRCEVGEVHVRDGIRSAFDMACIIGITGDFKGSLIISLKHQTAERLAARMMGEVAYTALENEDIASAVAELANTIAGMALTALDQRQVAMDITPPSIVIGDNNPLYLSGKEHMFVVPMKTDLGDIELSLTLKRNRVPV